ncbi:hypothetical protein [Dyadobacter sp. 32]|uniref:hypothetical protein n=1 Tax=Dyadobacter sp. 32 TaxID=538966 RepID=UPI0011EEBF25
MENSFVKASGVGLCLGSFISLLTMVLHPPAGSIDHIVRIQNVLIFSHVLAIACLPIMGFGAWGLSVLLHTDSRISTLSFIIFCFGLITAMIAAAINGLILPQFLSDSIAKPFDESVLKTVIRYGGHINVSMANIFIVCTSVSITIWCVLILHTARLSKGIAYFGFSLLGFEMVCLFLRVNFTDLHGFRIFVTGLACWEIAAGIHMRLRR